MMGHRDEKQDEHDAFCKMCRRYVSHTHKYLAWAKHSAAKRQRRIAKRQIRSTDWD
jgi:ribosomal protein L44E